MKKVFNVLLSLLLSVIFFISSMPVRTQAAGTFPTVNSFEIDTDRYNVLWYPSDIYEAKYLGKTVGKVYIICGVATQKSNPSKQVLLVKTEMRPEDPKCSLLQYYHGVCESMKVTLYYNENEMEESQYSPLTSQIIGSKNSTTSVQVGSNKKNGWNISGTIGCTYSLPYGGFKTVADSKTVGRHTSQRSIEYVYDREPWRWNPIIQSSAKREVNKPLNGDLIQTFAFEYNYLGTGKRPQIQVSVNAIFKVANNLAKTWYGDASNIVAGSGKIDLSFGLAGQK